MRLRLTPRDWLQTAIDARAIAAQLTDPYAKRVMEETADECELIAQDIGEIAAGLLDKDR
jgi:hypothetical protein